MTSFDLGELCLLDWRMEARIMASKRSSFIAMIVIRPRTTTHCSIQISKHETVATFATVAATAMQRSEEIAVEQNQFESFPEPAAEVVVGAGLQTVRFGLAKDQAACRGA